MLLSRKCVKLNSGALVFFGTVNHVHLCQDISCCTVFHNRTACLKLRQRTANSSRDRDVVWSVMPQKWGIAGWHQCAAGQEGARPGAGQLCPWMRVPGVTAVSNSAVSVLGMLVQGWQARERFEWGVPNMGTKAVLRIHSIRVLDIQEALLKKAREPQACLVWILSWPPRPVLIQSCITGVYWPALRVSPEKPIRHAHCALGLESLMNISGIALIWKHSPK